MSEVQVSRRYATRMTPEDRREQLLDATLAIIVRDGIHKVSIDAVAREADVTRPAVYARFRDTAELLRACIDREEAGAMQQVAPAVAAFQAGEVRDAFVVALQMFLPAVLAAPDRWRAIFALADVSDRTHRERVEKNRGLITALISARLTETNSCPPEADPDIAARLLFAVMWDAGRAVLQDPERFSADKVTTTIQALTRRFV